ncbi:hypothetical protein H1P_4390005 [Hyella patelloides LEGE 07179]|uniref:Uncharacterized protein n=1 Tax=Hyella patelloides LEGE 07179 TaxID=945734 RepID=A0A563VY41_9CYAN|nr:hypothetical protein [Hyella patelloides]VEP16341.1 hypothetical protein H1P_4390005 [Hyella patelloides LEGE 07179]
MRNGSGDEYYIVFNSDGAILKGFTHESKIWLDICKNDKLLPDFLAQVPNCFTKAITEPALEFQYSSFCIWRTYLDSNWNLVNYHLPSQEDNDLSDDLLFI